MTTLMRTHWRLTAAALAAAAVLFAVLLYNASPWLQDALDFSGELRVRGLTPPPPQTLALIISSLGLMVTSFGTAFTIILGLLYGFAWLIYGFSDPPPPLLDAIVTLHPVVHRYIPPPILGCVFFVCTPRLRAEEFSARAIVAGVIAVMIFPGVWAFTHGQGDWVNALLWLAIPVAIALWILLSPRPPQEELTPRVHVAPPILPRVEAAVVAERMRAETSVEPAQEVKGKAPDWLKQGQ